jgi:UDP-2,3-diacylglucosamine pyrophosphatase LpxH
MKVQDISAGSNRIQIISGGGVPTPMPTAWQPVLSGCQAIVVIPDMHMTPATSVLDNFKFGADAMIDLLKFLGNTKDAMDDPADLKIFQIGDMYELRFPGSHVNSTVTDISSSSDTYALILNMFKDLDANRLYGNHDFENRHFAGFNFYYSLGKVYLEHGFAADTYMANPLNPLNDPLMLVFLKMREFNTFVDTLEQAVGIDMSDKNFSWGVTSGKDEVSAMPTTADYMKDYKNIYDYYCARMRASSQGADCRITIVGHTHCPHIDASIDGGKYMYIDCGAWTTGRSDFLILTNEEAAICHFKRTGGGLNV